MKASRLLAGALAGAFAAWPMAILTEMIRRRLPPGERSELPPITVAHSIMNRTGLGEKLLPLGKDAVTLASHYGYGAFGGALYAMAGPRRARLPFLRGALFGLLVWAVSYLGWLPAAKILPTAAKWPRGRNVMMVAGHVVWGSIVALLLDRRQ